MLNLATLAFKRSAPAVKAPPSVLKKTVHRAIGTYVVLAGLNSVALLLSFSGMVRADISQDVQARLFQTYAHCRAVSQQQAGIGNPQGLASSKGDVSSASPTDNERFYRESSTLQVQCLMQSSALAQHPSMFGTLLQSDAMVGQAAAFSRSHTTMSSEQQATWNNNVVLLHARKDAAAAWDVDRKSLSAYYLAHHAQGWTGALLYPAVRGFLAAYNVADIDNGTQPASWNAKLLAGWVGLKDPMVPAKAMVVQHLTPISARTDRSVWMVDHAASPAAQAFWQEPSVVLAAMTKDPRPSFESFQSSSEQDIAKAWSAFEQKANDDELLKSLVDTPPLFDF